MAASTSQPIWGPDGSFASSSWQTLGCPQEYASLVLHPSPRRWGQQLPARSDLPGLGRGVMHSGENQPREARRRACGPAHEPAGGHPTKARCVCLSERHRVSHWPCGSNPSATGKRLLPAPLAGTGLEAGAPRPPPLPRGSRPTRSQQVRPPRPLTFSTAA